MTNVVLYISTLFIWGSTWIAIRYQLGTVNPLYSISYRFLIAGAILFIAATLREGSFPKFRGKEHRYLLLMGFLMFCFNYIMYYMATGLIPSGMVAVITALIIVFNIMFAVFLFKMPLKPLVLLGAAVGLTGIIVIFLPSLLSLKEDDVSVIPGIILAVIGVMSASGGNMVSIHLQKGGCSVLGSTSWGMLYGSLMTFGLALFTGLPTFDMSVVYITSLLYLSILGSAIAFYCYFTLLGRIGPDKAAYALVGTPVIALLISSQLEGLEWQLETTLGLVLVLVGNIIVLWKKS